MTPPRPLHPFAIKGNKSSARGMTAGDRVFYTIDGRFGRVDEFLHDGNAFVAFDDGLCETVKWNYLIPAEGFDPSPPTQVAPGWQCYICIVLSGGIGLFCGLLIGGLP